MSWFTPSADSWFGGGAHQAAAAAAQREADPGSSSSSSRKIHKQVPEEVLDRMDYYHLLGIHPEATAKEVTKIWREVARQWHPDKQHPDDREFCTRRFQKMQQGYEVLSDPKLRVLYDEWLRVKFQEFTFDGSFDDFQAYAKHSGLGGQSYEESILKSKEAMFQPSADDLKLLALTTGGLLLSAYVAYKMLIAPRLYISHVPFFLQLDWIMETLPTSFEVAITEMLLQAGIGLGDDAIPTLLPLPTKTERKMMQTLPVFGAFH